jgi:solute carrier family 25 carnitine/acylcarnitine transporter 20/29
MSTVASSAAARAATTAPKEVSLRTLYAGVGGPLVTVGLIQSANFCIYDSLRRALHKRDHPTSSGMDYMNNDSITNVAVSSMASGSFLSFITSPLLVVKTKQQIMTWDFRTALKDTMRKSVGSTKSVTSNFFIGFGPHFLSESVGRGIYFASYETLKRTMAAHNANSVGGESSSTTVTLPQRMAAAGMSGILCWSIIFPLDVLRNRLCAQAITQDAGNAWDMAKSMYAKEQFRPFYRGFTVTVLRAGPVAAAVLPVYDATLEWLNNN